MAKFPPGTPVRGIVTGSQVFGVLVRLDDLPDVPALLEIIHFKVIETDAQHRIEFPADYPPVGRESMPASWVGASARKTCASLSSATWIGVTGAGWPVSQNA